MMAASTSKKQEDIEIKCFLAKTSMGITQVMEEIGNPGFYQILLYICLWLCNSTVSINHLMMSVFGYTPPHSCKLPSGYLKNSSIPLETTNGKTSYSKCTIYQGFNVSLDKIAPCPDGWQFELNGKESTIVNEWSLVCDDKYLVSLATTIYFAGVMVGGALFGQLGDVIGRKPVLLFCLYGHIVLGVGVYFSNSYELFVVLRFFVGFLVQGIQTSSYVLMAEMTVQKFRPLCAGFFEVFWAIGTFWLASLSWIIQDWRNIQLALCLPSLITLFYIYFVPESLLWLINKEKTKEAENIIRRIAKFNKVELPSELHLKNEEPKEGTSKYFFHHLIKTPNIRRRTVLMAYIWLATSVGYYGLSLSLTSLAGSLYVNQFIGAVVELAAFISVIFVLKYFNRRYPLMFYYLVGGGTCIIAGVLKSRGTPGTEKTATGFAIIGKFGLSAGFATIFLFTVELFPTVVRSIGMGSCVFWARVGGMIAPQILLLGKYTFSELPFIIFGGLSLLAALVMYFVPETHGQILPETIEEIENKANVISINNESRIDTDEL